MRTAAAEFTIEHALLGYVFAHPRHGYEIYQQLADAGGLWQVWRLKQSQLYALLTKLEEAGYLAATMQSQEPRPPRKIYRLTAAGDQAFERWLQTPVTHGRQMRIEFLAKLYFAQRRGVASTASLIDQQMAACESWLRELERTDALLAEVQPKLQAKGDFFGFAVQQFRLNQIESFITWLTTCHEAISTADTREE
ncbi:MAG: PadR family transcriptional regulator [Caldilineaceae bacterium]